MKHRIGRYAVDSAAYQRSIPGDRVLVQIWAGIYQVYSSSAVQSGVQAYFVKLQKARRGVVEIETGAVRGSITFYCINDFFYCFILLSVSYYFSLLFFFIFLFEAC